MMAERKKRGERGERGEKGGGGEESDEEKLHFGSIQEEVEYWKRKARERREELEELEAAYNEFRDSSMALEEEMEAELQRAEKQLQEVTRAYSLLKTQTEEDMIKHQRNTAEAADTIEKMRVELETLKKEKVDLLQQRRRLEQDNDDLERREREATATNTDITMKLDQAIEETAWLRSEYEERVSKDEELIQRLREEINDQKSELASLRRKAALAGVRLRESSDSNGTFSFNIPQSPPLSRHQQLQQQHHQRPLSMEINNNFLNNIPPLLTASGTLLKTRESLRHASAFASDGTLLPFSSASSVSSSSSSLSLSVTNSKTSAQSLPHTPLASPRVGGDASSPSPSPPQPRRRRRSSLPNNASSSSLNELITNDDVLDKNDEERGRGEEEDRNQLSPSSPFASPSFSASSSRRRQKSPTSSSSRDRHRRRRRLRSSSSSSRSPSPSSLSPSSQQQTTLTPENNHETRHNKKLMNNHNRHLNNNSKLNGSDSPLDLVNDMLALVKDLECRLSAYQSPFASPTNSAPFAKTKSSSLFPSSLAFLSSSIHKNESTPNHDTDYRTKLKNEHGVNKTSDASSLPSSKSHHQLLNGKLESFKREREAEQKEKDEDRMENDVDDEYEEEHYHWEDEHDEGREVEDGSYDYDSDSLSESDLM
ncbi:hypothetical protein QOT17_015067 [Balamuthia mandrillaris]